MNLKENIAEGIRSIKGNMLRTVLTATIIAFGITALVGILTTIDGMQKSVDQSFAGLGANSFDILVEQFRGRISGTTEKPTPPIYYRQAKEYKELFTGKTEGTVSIYTQVTGNAEVKFGSLKTNPNTQIIGVDENFLDMKGYKLLAGRNFNANDLNSAANVVVLGTEIAKTLFPNVSPINKIVAYGGNKYKVIGTLDKKGSITGGGDDRVVLMPLETGRKFDLNGQMSYSLTTSVPQVNDMDYIIGEATGVMRRVRGDEITEKDSFEIERSDALAKDFEEVSGYLRIGGFGISFITLLGASIALMNIMMVSVTERTREIGIRKALGASPGKIRLQFLLEAIVICLLGGVAGIVLGLAIGNIISTLVNESPLFIVPWLWIMLGLAVCISVGLISGYYPAYKASKLDPIESLRYE